MKILENVAIVGISILIAGFLTALLSLPVMIIIKMVEIVYNFL